MDCEQRSACHGGGGVVSQFSHNGIDLCGRVSPYFISCSFLEMDLTGDGETPEPKRFDAAEIDAELVGHSTPSDLCGWAGQPGQWQCQTRRWATPRKWDGNGDGNKEGGIDEDGYEYELPHPSSKYRLIITSGNDEAEGRILSGSPSVSHQLLYQQLSATISNYQQRSATISITFRDAVLVFPMSWQQRADDDWTSSLAS